MTISYSAPLNAALQRTKAFLFQPFDLMRWLAVGFTAWLAKISDGDWWGAGSNYSADFGDRSSEAVNLFESTYQAVVASVILTVLVLGAIVVLVAFAVLLLWISSRARFMFLENCARGHGHVTEPWNRFREAGMSLFLWRLGFGVISTVIIGTVLVVTLLMVIPFIRAEVYDSRMWSTVAFGAGLAAILGLLCKFVDLLLNGFVVPVMYKTGLPVTDAWRRFLPLFRERILEFVMFGLLTLAIHLGVFVIVGVAGLLTCCVGFLVLAMPYLNAVLLLPVLVFFRLFPVEFLNQFGDEFRIELRPGSPSLPADPPPTP